MVGQGSKEFCRAFRITRQGVHFSGEDNLKRSIRRETNLAAGNEGQACESGHSHWDATRNRVIYSWVRRSEGKTSWRPEEVLRARVLLTWE